MSVKIQVLDSSNRPVEGADVIVGWQSGGTSSRRTNRNGIADLECSAGTANYVQVNGRTVLHTVWLADATMQVSDR